MTYKHYKQSCIVIENQKIIIIDPVNIKDKNLPTADIVLISHTHPDHFSIEDIKSVIDENTQIITSHDIDLNELTNNHQTVLPNEEVQIEDIKILATPAYNLDKQFHPKDNNWLGFLIKTSNSSYYFTGDSDDIDEFSNYSNADVVFIPVSGTYVMTSKEAINATITKLKPKVAIPIHFGEVVGSIDDAKEFVEKVKKAGIESKIIKED